MAKTKDAIKIIDKMTRTDPQLEAMVAVSAINAEVAQLIYPTFRTLNCHTTKNGHLGI